MQLKKVLEGIEYTLVGVSETAEISRFISDSRQAEKNTLFAALPGISSGDHGIRYAENAASAGAIVFCDQALSEDIPHVRVSDVQTALSLAAANFYDNPARNLSLIGVTGTNGKTTTTHLIRSVLERCGKPCGLIGTNHICYGNTVLESKSTTPDAIVFQSLLADMVKAGCEYVAMEVSSHALALGRVHGMRFAAAAFTNLTQDHLDFHKTMEAYAETKASLFAMSDVAVINVDDEAAPLMLRAASGRKITYSTKKNEATLIAKSIRLLPDAVEFVALDESGLERMRLGIPGEFSVYNALTVIGICRGLGLSLSDISAALVESKGIAGRAEIVAVDRDYTVMIDYAHTPDALENILRMVRGVAKGRVITVFGCGGDRDKAKRPLMGKIAETLSDVCIVTSDNPRREEPMAIINDILSGMAGKNHIAMENRREAIAAALDMANPGDFILLAGKGHETYQEINGQKHHLDEREVIHAHLSGK